MQSNLDFSDLIPLWTGEYLGERVFIDTNQQLGHSVKGSKSSVLSLEKHQFTDFFTIHRDSEIISYDLTRSVLAIEQASTVRFADFYEKSKLIHLKLLFQLVSLATRGDLFAPESIQQLSSELIERRLHCPIFTAEASALETHFQVLQVCHDYLNWKMKSISARNRLTHDTQAKADYALRKVESFGYLLSKERVDALYDRTHVQIQTKIENLKSFGWAPGYQSERKYEEAVQALSINLPKTATGKVSSAERHIVEYADQHPFFREYLDFHSLRKLQSTYLSKMRGTEILFPHYRTLVSTGRTSSYDPNFQNFPKDQEVRECFIPRPNHKFLVADYATIELCALAQTCISLFGQSRMADLINDGVDLHRWFASVLLGKALDQVTKEERTYAKACNFGFPGGLGVKQFLQYAKYTYGISSLTLQQASDFKSKWLEAFPEMKMYLDASGQKFRSKITATTITGRMRSNCTFTQAKNFPFQGLASDGGKLALYALIKADYRVVNYVHDEFVLEIPSDNEDLMAEQIIVAECMMIDQMQNVCPDLKIGIESSICDFWKKL